MRSFVGVFAGDKLHKINNFPASFVLNTDKSNGPDQDWVAVFINKEGFGKYFQFYGLEPLHNKFIEFMNKNCSRGWCHSIVMLQGLTTITCEHFCILYIYLRSLGLSLCKVIKLFSNNGLLMTKLYLNYIKNSPNKYFQ